MRLNRSKAPMLIGLGLALVSLQGAAAFGVAPLVANALEDRNVYALTRASSIAGRALASSARSLVTSVVMDAFVHALGGAPGVRTVMVRMTPEPCTEAVRHAPRVHVLMAPLGVLEPVCAPPLPPSDRLARPAIFRPIPAPLSVRVGVWGNVL